MKKYKIEFVQWIKKKALFTTLQKVDYLMSKMTHFTLKKDWYLYRVTK